MVHGKDLTLPLPDMLKNCLRGVHKGIQAADVLNHPSPSYILQWYDMQLGWVELVEFNVPLDT